MGRDNLNSELANAVAAAGLLLAKVRKILSARVRKNGKIETDALNALQHEAHGAAWFGAYFEVLRQTADYAQTLRPSGRLGELEELLVRLLFGEYLAQMLGGIAMSQTEIARPADFGLTPEDLAQFNDGAVARLIAAADAGMKFRIVELLQAARGGWLTGDPGLDDTLEAVYAQIHKYVEAEIAPNAHDWHLANAYVPIEIVDELARLGIFSLTLPEEYGGSGLGKKTMCVIAEELSRGFISVGSLGTRTEIAAELILTSGTKAQKQKWLPRLASGACLPTAVFTEPDTGSNLAAVRTRAVKRGKTYAVTGNKTWITHAARTDLMTLLARTDPEQPGYRGLSMFLAEKPRGGDDDPFPAKGMSGSEIHVIGYRGMKEYEIAFDGFEVPEEALLGGLEGAGFKQLMETFESARIQTAARAVGVAQSALELGLDYAAGRKQFGKTIIQFPRIANKLALTAAEILGVRQLTHFAARSKDDGRRCDLEAGMAKLLAARIAWSAADNAVQIHGGNGFAVEFPVSRILCDARILSIFEGASEIQAQIIARRLLENVN